VSLLQALEDSGSSLEEFRAHSERFQSIRAALQEEGVEVIFQHSVQGQALLTSDSEETE
jgi:hypothetical protein